MDQVFATLDPTMREVKLPSARRIILSDTVGFISDLPTMLVAAFRATLEEVVEADLILHVRDIAHEETEAQASDVEKVLGDLGIDTLPVDNHILEVWNKIDLLSHERRGELQHESRRNARPPVLVSAATGEGMAPLLDSLDAQLSTADEVLDLIVPGSQGRCSIGCMKTAKCWRARRAKTAASNCVSGSRARRKPASSGSFAKRG